MRFGVLQRFPARRGVVGQPSLIPGGEMPAPGLQLGAVEAFPAQ
jgi:hypothetical protein